MRHKTTDINLLFKVIASPVRRSILLNLSGDDLSLSYLAALYDMSLPGIAKHLNLLEDAKLVRSYHAGYTSMYHLRSKTILKLIEGITLWYTSAKSA